MSGFDFNEWHLKQVGDWVRANPDTPIHMRRYYWPVKPIVCADGFTVSAQASDRHYCHPRASLAWSYTHVELGRVSLTDLPNGFKRYSDGSIFAYVPVEMLNKLIDAHGGLADDDIVPI